MRKKQVSKDGRGFEHAEILRIASRMTNARGLILQTLSTEEKGPFQEFWKAEENDRATRNCSQQLFRVSNQPFTRLIQYEFLGKTCEAHVEFVAVCETNRSDESGMVDERLLNLKSCFFVPLLESVQKIIPDGLDQPQYGDFLYQLYLAFRPGCVFLMSMFVPWIALSMKKGINVMYLLHVCVEQKTEFAKLMKMIAAQNASSSGNLSALFESEGQIIGDEVWDRLQDEARDLVCPEVHELLFGLDDEQANTEKKQRRRKSVLRHLFARWEHLGTPTREFLAKHFPEYFSEDAVMASLLQEQSNWRTTVAKPRHRHQRIQRKGRGKTKGTASRTSSQQFHSEENLICSDVSRTSGLIRDVTDWREESSSAPRSSVSDHTMSYSATRTTSVRFQNDDMDEIDPDYRRALQEKGVVLPETTPPVSERSKKKRKGISRISSDDASATEERYIVKKSRVRRTDVSEQTAKGSGSCGGDGAPLTPQSMVTPSSPSESNSSGRMKLPSEIRSLRSSASFSLDSLDSTSLNSPDAAPISPLSPPTNFPTPTPAGSLPTAAVPLTPPSIPVPFSAARPPAGLVSQMDPIVDVENMDTGEEDNTEADLRVTSAPVPAVSSDSLESDSANEEVVFGEDANERKYLAIAKEAFEGAQRALHDRSDDWLKLAEFVSHCIIDVMCWTGTVEKQAFTFLVELAALIPSTFVDTYVEMSKTKSEGLLILLVDLFKKERSAESSRLAQGNTDPVDGLVTWRSATASIRQFIGRMKQPQPFIANSTTLFAAAQDSNRLLAGAGGPFPFPTQQHANLNYGAVGNPLQPTVDFPGQVPLTFPMPPSPYMPPFPAGVEYAHFGMYSAHPPIPQFGFCPPLDNFARMPQMQTSMAAQAPQSPIVREQCVPKESNPIVKLTEAENMAELLKEVIFSSKEAPGDNMITVITKDGDVRINRKFLKGMVGFSRVRDARNLSKGDFELYCYVLEGNWHFLEWYQVPIIISAAMTLNGTCDLTSCCKTLLKTLSPNCPSYQDNFKLVQKWSKAPQSKDNVEYQSFCAFVQLGRHRKVKKEMRRVLYEALRRLPLELKVVASWLLILMNVDKFVNVTSCVYLSDEDL